MKTVGVAGASGEQGLKVIRELSRLGASVRALVRQQVSAELAAQFKQWNAAVVKVDFDDTDSMAKACAGLDCMVSTLSGERDVIMGAQARLLRACVQARVRKFIPSAFAIDFNAVPAEKNRNLAVLREFDRVLQAAEIDSTTVLNGAFADMLTGQAPFILSPLKRVIYFSHADQKMDFTTRDNAATFTAHAALDENAPRYLRIAGDQVSARDLARIMTEIAGARFRLLKVGSTAGLEVLIKALRKLIGDRGGKYPIWQGFQYMHNMFAGLGKFATLDNDRYPGIRWTPVADVLREHFDPSRKDGHG